MWEIRASGDMYLLSIATPSTHFQMTADTIAGMDSLFKLHNKYKVVKILLTDQAEQSRVK